MKNDQHKREGKMSNWRMVKSKKNSLQFVDRNNTNFIVNKSMLFLTNIHLESVSLREKVVDQFGFLNQKIPKKKNKNFFTRRQSQDSNFFGFKFRYQQQIVNSFLSNGGYPNILMVSNRGRYLLEKPYDKLVSSCYSIVFDKINK